MDNNFDDPEMIPVLTEIVAKAAGPSEWLEARLRDELLPRVQQLLDEKMQKEVQHVLSRTTEAMALELRDVLDRVTREVVSRVISEEVARLRSEQPAFPVPPRG